MDAQSRERLKDIVADAIELAPEKRREFVNAACGGDDQLRREVESLLKQNEIAGGFLLDSVLPSGRMRPLAPGTVLASRFEIVRSIGQGGMGTVYAARDLQLSGDVALKTVLPEIAGDPQAIARFRREIQAAKSVTHPNVCRVYDLGFDPESGTTFLTMELLEGETLAERLKPGRMSPRDALPIAIEMAAGLKAAHEAGIVHRDFKPANVILARGRKGESRVVITDFGLAQPVNSLQPDLPGGNIGLAGSPDYMAPEQFTGNAVTSAADIFAFGVVLYEMVTGQRPFQADTFLETALKRLTDRPAAPSQLNSELDPRWDRTILRCLSIKPEERFENALQVTAALSGTVRGADSNKRCPSCDHTNPAKARYCEECGAILRRFWVIGTARDCHVELSASTVSGHHCRLTELDESFLIEDLGSRNGTFVENRRIQQPVEIAWGAEIRLGSNVPFPWDELQRASSSKIVRIGRDPDNDTVLDHPLVSAHHARIVERGDKYILEDLGSTNGTAIGNPARKITTAPVVPEDTVFFGSLPVRAARLISGTTVLGDQDHGEVSLPGTVILGRDPNCQKVLAHPMVSWRHARLSESNGKHVIEDLGSTNGTFVNGRRIKGRVALSVGDTIGLGSYTFQFTGGSSFRERNRRGNVTIEAKGVTVDVPGRRLIEDISLTIFPSEIVALMGAAGAGKTTLMSALNGYVRPTGGSVLLNGVDLYRNFDRFRGGIGYAPQDDIMHHELTVLQALYFSAKLRLPADYDDKAIKERIGEVLELLAMQGTENVIIGSPERKGISGGQRKRVSLAMELLTDPDILFLDEPTSGLSSEDAFLVMKVLRNLADSGKTILMTIHQPGLEVFRMMDSLALIGKDRGSVSPGKLVYFGPAYPDAVEFFNPNGVPGARPGVDPSPDEILRGLSNEPAATWLDRFSQSQYKQQYVDQRSGTVAKQVSASENGDAPRRGRGPQWRTLVRRCLTIKLQDRTYTASLIGQSLLIAILVAVAFRSDKSDKAIAVFIMVMAAIFSGCVNASREIVGEWAIYHRERMVNLSLWRYVMSKIAVLGPMCVIQCAILVGVISAGCKLKGDFLPAAGFLTLASLAALGYGLIISAVSRTSERAMTLIVPTLMPMLIFGGAIVRLDDLTGPISKILPSRWAFEGMLQLLSLDARREFFFQTDQYSVAAAAWALAAMAAILFTIVAVILKSRDVH